MSVNSTLREIATKAQQAPHWTFAGPSGALSGACWHHAPVHGVEVATDDHVIVFHTGGSTRVRRFDERGRLVASGSRIRSVSIMPAGSRSIWDIDEPSDVLHLYVPAALLDRCAQQRGLDRAPALAAWFAHDDPWLAGLFQMIRAEIPARFDGAATPLLLDEIGASVARHLIEHAGAEAAPRGASQPRGGLRPAALKRVLGAMRDDPAGDHRIADLSASVAMSDDHFIRAFRESVGIAPHRYLLALRMQRAQRLLAERPGIRVAEVSRSCGFSSAAHFAVQFRRATGATPSAWRCDRGAEPPPGRRPG